MKNRTIIGVICVVAALVLSFAVAPLVNRFSDSRFEIVCVKRDVTKGHQTVTVGGYGLPTGVIKDKADVIGKYAACDMVSEDFILPSKLTDNADSADDVFMNLDGSQVAMSITIQSFAGGLSGKLANGDIVQLIVNTDEEGYFVPNELQYVRVITSTTAKGIDKDELIRNDDGSYELPTTLTLLVDTYQAKLLAEYENNSKIHAVLVSRGNEEQANEFLEKQNTILDEIEVSDNG